MFWTHSCQAGSPQDSPGAGDARGAAGAGICVCSWPWGQWCHHPLAWLLPREHSEPLLRGRQHLCLLQNTCPLMLQVVISRVG